MSYHVTNPNDTAFPDQHLIGQGLTKREFFAAIALQGLLAKRFAPRSSNYPALAVNIADQLILQLNQEQTNEK